VNGVILRPSDRILPRRSALWYPSCTVDLGADTICHVNTCAALVSRTFRTLSHHLTLVTANLGEAATAIALWRATDPAASAPTA
jgi:hypothetical protein